jgi:K+-transporting ATPase ATPase C chain
MFAEFRRQTRPALVALAAFSIICGLAYPLAVGGIAHVAFRRQAHGSLVIQGGRPAGSALIGQPFSDPGYFWGRPSATGPFPYNAAASSGSNQGPTNPALAAAVGDRIMALRAADATAGGAVPADLVTASGSGLDPHISPAAAEFQVRRVAAARRADESTVRSLVARFTEARQMGVLGEPRVNVLMLNLALDSELRQ